MDSTGAYAQQRGMGGLGARQQPGIATTSVPSDSARAELGCPTPGRQCSRSRRPLVALKLRSDFFHHFGRSGSAAMQIFVKTLTGARAPRHKHSGPLTRGAPAEGGAAAPGHASRGISSPASPERAAWQARRSRSRSSRPTRSRTSRPRSRTRRASRPTSSA